MASDHSEDIERNIDGTAGTEATAPTAGASETAAPQASETASDDPASDVDEDAGADEALGNPGLSIATAIFGIVGVILALFVSWILSIVAGVVAVALGTMAKRQHAPYPRIITAGKVLGFICVVANAVMAIGYVIYLIQLGVL